MGMKLHHPVVNSHLLRMQELERLSTYITHLRAWDKFTQAEALALVENVKIEMAELVTSVKALIGPAAKEFDT